MGTIIKDYLSSLIEKIREDNLLLPGEEFILEDFEREKIGRYYIERGVIYDEDSNEIDAYTLKSLLYGYANIIKKQYKPKFGDCYYTISVFGQETSTLCAKWDDLPLDYERFYMGICFKTEGEAEAMEGPYMRKLKEFYNETDK